MFYLRIYPKCFEKANPISYLNITNIKNTPNTGDTSISNLKGYKYILL